MQQQVRFSVDPLADTKPAVSDGVVFGHPGQVLSIESQLKLRELYEYVENCLGVLGEIRKDLSLFESNPEDGTILHKASERLEHFCIESDSWGFNALYQIGLSLQMLLLNAGSRIQDGVFWNALNSGLAMLSALLEQCENDFRWRLATADMLDSLGKLSHD
jgi:hypothetical protein